MAPVTEAYGGNFSSDNLGPNSNCDRYDSQDVGVSQQGQVKNERDRGNEAKEAARTRKHLEDTFSHGIFLKR